MDGLSEGKQVERIGEGEIDEEFRICSVLKVFPNHQAQIKCPDSVHPILRPTYRLGMIP